MLDGYRPSGGLAACPELLSLCRRHGGADVATLARWIVGRAVVAFEWQSQTWFPLFQFRAPDFAPAPRMQPLSTELSGSYNSWDAAHWFVIPNPRLGGQAPVTLLDSDPGAVLRAARNMLMPNEAPPRATASCTSSDADHGSMRAPAASAPLRFA